MINFNGFSADSFEQLTRALAVKIVGPGITIFGDGPDGGREASFKGKVSFPHPPRELWDGYGVLQAKFKSKNESTSRDQAWALSELKKELARWTTSKKRRPKPDYFIFCTNVSLTSVSGGGKDQVEKLLSLKKHGFKGFAIWDANQLESFIDGQLDIRRRFCHFFSTGDLLAEYAGTLAFGRADAENILHGYVAREFLADEDARLSQAGDRSEDRISLVDVFVDLPSGSERVQEADDYIVDNNAETSLKELLRIGGFKLDPLALSETSRVGDVDSGLSGQAIFGRYVFLGGPGSGKSTIGQFLAQIHRGALLARRPKYRLEQNIINSISLLKNKCESDECCWPKTPRYPFRIELNAFAKSLSAKDGSGVASLSDYIRKDLSKDVVVQHSELRAWLAAYPWLIIFDGLDEVPPSSNRREVISAIQDFLNEARDVEADLMIVASSRPDGYAGEFDGSEVAHRYLQPLSSERALVCAQKYVDAKIARKDKRRATEAMETLVSAVQNPLIAKLMHSPLQVTFMVTVVAASGKPSESRWQLFNDYYRTIYERELHKAVPPFDKALNERRSDIDALHHRVGFILQTRSESSGGTKSDMAVEEFESLVKECLSENELPEIELVRQTQMIIGAAGQRLVFLTSRTPGRLSFDVRSLQEYMAAACLTNEDSAEAILRLEKIASSAYWRNVLLFSVGRFFVEHQLRPYRGRIRILCDDLNRRSKSDESSKTGSRLALDVLVSGVVGNVPLASRALTKISLELLCFPPDSDEKIFESLAAIYKPDASAEFQEMLNLRLEQKNSNSTLSAWRLLKNLAERDVDWANELMFEKWPRDVMHCLKIVEAWVEAPSFMRIKLGKNSSECLARLIPKISPLQVAKLLPQMGVDVVPVRPWLAPLVELFCGSEQVRGKVKIYESDRFAGASAYINLIGDRSSEKIDSIQELFLEADLCLDWMPLRSILNFENDPSREKFIISLSAIASSSSETKSLWRQLSAWPIAQSISLSDLSVIPEDSSLDWISVDRRIRAEGIDLAALLAESFCWSYIAIDGIKAWSMTQPDKDIPERYFTDSVLRELDGESSVEHKKNLLFLFSFGASSLNALHFYPPAKILKYLRSINRKWTADSFFISSVPSTRVGEEWVSFFDVFGRMDISPVFNFKTSLSQHAHWLFEQYFAGKRLTGLLRLAAFLGWPMQERNDEGTEARFSLLEDIVRNSSNKDEAFPAMIILINRSGVSKNWFGRSCANVRKIIKSLNQRELEFLIRIVDRQSARSSELFGIIDILAEEIPSEMWHLLGRIAEIRSTLIQSISSGFDLETLRVLRLPISAASSSEVAAQGDR